MSDEEDIDMDAFNRILERQRDEPDHIAEIAVCIRDHTAARGVDLWAVEIEGLTAAEWAEQTDRDQSTVARNVRRAIREDNTPDQPPIPDGDG